MISLFHQWTQNYNLLLSIWEDNQYVKHAALFRTLQVFRCATHGGRCRKIKQKLEKDAIVFQELHFSFSRSGA